MLIHPPTTHPPTTHSPQYTPTHYTPSTGVTLRENNLKEIKGGRILDSQGILVANRRALLERPGLMEVCHELIERLEAHLKADQYYR